MGRDELVALLATHKSEIRRFGVASLSLFGSAARGEERPDRDLDFLVRFDGPATLNGFMGLKLFLEEVLRRPVDLVTERALKPRLRRAIEQDLVRVA